MLIIVFVLVFNEVVLFLSFLVGFALDDLVLFIVTFLFGLYEFPLRTD